MSDIDTNALIRADRLLQVEAAILRECHNLDQANPDWKGELEAKEMHDEILEISAQLCQIFVGIQTLQAELTREKERGDYGWKNVDILEKARQTEMEKRDALTAAIRELLKFHQEGDDGAELPREYWSPGYREAVEQAESLIGPNVKDGDHA